MNPEDDLLTQIRLAFRRAEAAEAKLAKAREALNRLAIDANRVLDVYPRDARGTYYDDLRASVLAARKLDAQAERDALRERVTEAEKVRDIRMRLADAMLAQRDAANALLRRVDAIRERLPNALAATIRRHLDNS